MDTFEAKSLIMHLINDTTANIIHWNRIGSWGGSICSSDFREINPILAKLTSNDPLAFNHWSNMLIASVMNGFVYLGKQPNIPPIHSIYLQTDCHAKIAKLTVSSKLLQTLYEEASKQLIIDECEIINLGEAYHNSHCQDGSFEPETG